MSRRLDDLLHGPHLRLPRVGDAVSEWWARRRPRSRMLIGVLLALGLLLGLDARVRAIDGRWGGPPQVALVATSDLAVGEGAVAVRRMRLPPVALPPDAVTELPASATLALAAPRGTVLTRHHVDPRGPATGLSAGMRAVPLPTEAGWGIVAGGWVDVWVLGDAEAPARLVARARPVLQVRDDPAGLTSLVGLSGPEVEAVTTGLATGRVLLAHAPAPR
jgi:hypothetical protein